MNSHLLNISEICVKIYVEVYLRTEVNQHKIHSGKCSWENKLSKALQTEMIELYASTPFYM